MILAAFIILLILLLTLVPVSFIINLMFKPDGFNAEVSVIVAHVIKVFSWNLKEGGLKFLKKKKKDVAEENKPKKNILDQILKKVFDPNSILNLKRIRFLKFEVKGRIATNDAALTALTYGSVCSFIAIVLPLFDMQRSQFDFYPDFNETKPDFDAACIIRVRIIHIIYLIVEGLSDKILKGRWQKHGTASY